MSIPSVQVRTTPLYSVGFVTTQDRVFFCSKGSLLNERHQWSWATGGLPTVFAPSTTIVRSGPWVTTWSNVLIGVGKVSSTDSQFAPWDSE